ncbi:hypothetical protein QFC20_002288 [Naganishia adeliensis]|uniref:Uncharacterized protein n=1 Tax=Naganishia adeliensis TaxID=92952 RepID=A0ACC2WKW4_9TREE|nr:hypothetical protein QFC20_002288 [Naganishia adeliensis]
MADIMDKQQGGPTFLQALGAGAISGLSVDFLFFPIDTIKTRQQSPQGFWKAGGFKGVYRGVGMVGAGSAPGSASFFTTYEFLKQQLPKRFSVFRENPSLNHLAGSTGGEFMACLIRVPTEVVKSRAQISAYGKDVGTFGAAVKLMQIEGLRGFYRGFGITLARDIPFTAIQFPLYEKLKSLLSIHYLPNQRKPLPHEAALCGSLAGGFAGGISTPLDVVKTRVMLEAKSAHPSPTDPASSGSALSIPSRMRRIAQEEGVKTLFRGGMARTTWISLGGAIFLGAYETVMSVIRKDDTE